MKYLSDYTEEAQTKLFKECGAFFAFSQKQFDEKKVTGVKYIALDGGLLVESDKVETLLEGLKTTNEEGIKLDIEENGKSTIIQRELANHEAQITCSITDTVEALSGYGFSKEDIANEYQIFFNHCVENNLF